MTEFHVNATLFLVRESTHLGMDKPVKQRIAELERRIQQLHREMLDNQKTRTERNHRESELRAAQQALDLYKEAIKLERQSRRN